MKGFPDCLPHRRRAILDWLPTSQNASVVRRPILVLFFLVSTASAKVTLTGAAAVTTIGVNVLTIKTTISNLKKAGRATKKVAVKVLSAPNRGRKP